MLFHKETISPNNGGVVSAPPTLTETSWHLSYTFPKLESATWGSPAGIADRYKPVRLGLCELASLLYSDKVPQTGLVKYHFIIIPAVNMAGSWDSCPPHGNGHVCHVSSHDLAPVPVSWSPRPQSCWLRLPQRPLTSLIASLKSCLQSWLTGLNL